MQNAFAFLEENIRYLKSIGPWARCSCFSYETLIIDLGAIKHKV
jgi:hypothetical protein